MKATVYSREAIEIARKSKQCEYGHLTVVYCDYSGHINSDISPRVFDPQFGYADLFIYQKVTKKQAEYIIFCLRNNITIEGIKCELKGWSYHD